MSNFNWSCQKRNVKYYFTILNSVLTFINSIFVSIVGVKIGCHFNNLMFFIKKIKLNLLNMGWNIVIEMNNSHRPFILQPLNSLFKVAKYVISKPWMVFCHLYWSLIFYL